MFDFNLFTLSGTLIAVTYLPLFALILLKGRSKLSLIYSLHILCIALWGIFSFFIGLSNNLQTSILLWKFACIPVFFIPVFFYHSILLLSQKKEPFVLKCIYTQAVIGAILLLTENLHSSYFLIGDEFYYVRGNILYKIIFFIWLLIASIALIKLYNFFKSKFPNDRGQIILLIVSAVAFQGGTLNFMPIFDIDIYPYGNFLIPIASFLITYAIFKHQLLNIRIVINKSLVYSMLIAITFLTFITLVTIFESILQSALGYSHISISFFIAFFLGLFLLPIRNKLQFFLDRYIFKASREEMAYQLEHFKQAAVESEKYKLLSTLSSGVAHEVKNPLTAIKTFSEYLPDKLDDKNFLKNFSSIVGQEVDRINDLVNQLMSYGKPSPLQLQKANIYKLLDDSLDILSSKFIEKKIRVIKIYPNKKVHFLNIDPNQIKQALLNILLNAIDAMPTGGKLTVSTHIAKNHFEITVEDTGSGINKKDLGHIFDPFYSGKDMSTGLGLSITETIIKQHNGKIKVKSKDGVGTKFTIQLPINA